ncbi:poly(ethylene terephthalate) hydrolase family protein [Fodinicola feengrottensis]|uniref:PET hydrolase/cutinase-like domain-containing protein n=1 Tax=Fodinicola feengrottensis TaxID=435914 RepID=A0ABN2H7H5_9ACTN|nr:alpha/beta hydrolase [Fodinicola feengrottensis]
MSKTSHIRLRHVLTVTAAAAAILLGSLSPANAATYPVESAYTAAGPYATTTGTVGSTYDLYYPSNYATLGFKSPIITWGNGTNANPTMYSTLLSHLASYGFTVIASTLPNTGSGNEIDAAAHYLVTQNSTTGSVFNGNLDIHHVAAVGHSQGAGGATRAATSDPALITTLMTFSLPNTIWVGSNPDCPTASDCMYNPAQVTQPAFLISTHGGADGIIASPATEKGYFTSLPGHGALGIIQNSDGKAADHSASQDIASGGTPDGLLGYATAWLTYQLRGDTTAAGAFTGAHPELPTNTNWPGSAAK